jgi:hypothetical protein
MDADAERAAVRAHIAALSSGEAPAVLAALAALAAPAYALPPPVGAGAAASAGASAGAALVDAWPWLPWLTHVARALSSQPPPLCDALAPLLLDERFTDAALALCVPLAAVLALAVEGLAAGLGSEAARAMLHSVDDVSVLTPLLDALAESLISLLLDAVRCLNDVTPDGVAAAALVARTERVLRALCDTACFESRLADIASADSVLCIRQPELRAALTALLWRPAPASGAPNVLAGGAAQLLVYLVGENGCWSDDPEVAAPDVALLRAALAALQETWSGARTPAWGGFPYGCEEVLRASPPRALLAVLLSAIVDNALAQTHVAGTRQLTKLILPQPGALAAITRAVVWAGDSAVLSILTNGAVELPTLPDGSTAPPLQTHALCQSALLDGELCLADVLSPAFASLQNDAADVQERFVDACADLASLELLARPPRGAALPAAAALALLAPHAPDAAAALLQSGDALATLARAYCRACVAPPWRQAGAQWRDAAAAKLRHARLRCALATAAAYARIAQPQPQRATADDVAPPAKRLRAGALLLTASDVNVRRHDSVTLLLSGEPLYVNAMLIEKASPLLADLISGVAATSAAGALAPVVVPAPADVAPEAFHALMCTAVEHTYTGELREGLPAESLLPLWCVARALQMDALRDACACALSPAALRAAPAPLLARAADVALRHGRDEALLRHAAAALLLRAPALGEEEDALVADALLCGDAAGGEHVGAAADALGDAMASVMRDALLLQRA